MEGLDKKADQSLYLTETQWKYIVGETKGSRGKLYHKLVNKTPFKTISCRGAKDQRIDITNFVSTINPYPFEIGKTYVKEWGIRKLTPQECFRLMGLK